MDGRHPSLIVFRHGPTRIASLFAERDEPPDRPRTPRCAPPSFPRVPPREFRRAVYAWRYDAAAAGDEASCLPRQLQRLFAMLQASAAVVVHRLSMSISDTPAVQHMYIEPPFQTMYTHSHTPAVQ
jgi:hypothetical protein